MNFNEILYGVAYYDEYMPYDRIETDFKMIRDAGMNVIRIAESTWSTWEPKEGVFDFTHLHRMLDCATKYELKVIVGTPTYAIPSWLAKKYPDTAWCYGNHDLSYVWHKLETGCLTAVQSVCSPISYRLCWAVPAIKFVSCLSCF